MRRLSFCGSFLRGSGAAFLLLPDLIQNKSQAGDRCQESAEHGSHQGILAGQFAETAELLSRQDAAFDNATLDGQVQLVLLSKLANNASGCDGVAGGAGHSGSAVQNLREIVAAFLCSEISQSVLNNGVCDASRFGYQSFY